MNQLPKTASLSDSITRKKVCSKAREQYGYAFEDAKRAALIDASVGKEADTSGRHYAAERAENVVRQVSKKVMSKRESSPFAGVSFP